LDDIVQSKEISVINTESATHPVTIGSLEVPGATLHYELRGSGPLLALHAAPMDAVSFAPAADLLAADFTVLTSDPRGIALSMVSDPARDVSPDERADDLAALLTNVDAGPARVFGSSGGAVSALALAQRHPALVEAVVAHEPPLAELLPDRDRIRRETQEMVAIFLAGDRVRAWQLFLRTADIEMPPEVFAMIFGDAPVGRAAEDERFSFEHMEEPTTFWVPDLPALRATTTRVIVAVGEESTGQLCDRTSSALAAALDREVVSFPGDHIGFVGDPAGFAARLRDVFADR
jgi:pimeloyl-ACP methyl ester carboxylesterase